MHGFGSRINDLECAAGSWLALSVTAYAVRNSPSHLALLDASPLWDGALDMAAKLPGKLQSFRHARGSLSEGAGKTVRF